MVTAIIYERDMFIVQITYTKPLDQVDALLAAHRQFLDRNYANGNFLLSGRKVPRTGGVILVNAGSLAAVESLVREDPFHQGQVAEYAIVEFVPTMAADGLTHLLAPA